MKNIMAYENEDTEFGELQVQLLADIKDGKVANELMIAIHNGIFEDKKMLREMWQKAREMVPDAEVAGAEGGEDEMEEMVVGGAEGGEDEQVEDVHEAGEDELVEEDDIGIEEEDLLIEDELI